MPLKSTLTRPWDPIINTLKLDGYDIRKYRATDIADELTIINQSLLLHIKEQELYDLAFLSIERERLAPNIMLMFEFYDRTVSLFATQILRQKTNQARASVMIHLFLVLQKLFMKNHDIHSIRIILAAYDHPSVFRLRDTWQLFRLQKPRFYNALKYLWHVLSQENNWNDYRSWIEEKLIKDRLQNNEPMLLFMGYLLSKLIIDHYHYYQIFSNQKKTSLSARVNIALMEYIKTTSKIHTVR